MKFLAIICFILVTHLCKSQSWQPVAGSIPGVQYTGIATSTSSPAIVAATLNDGIYRSLDSGNTWQQVHTIQDSIFSLIHFDDKFFCAGGKGFTYVSEDSGVTWTNHTFPFPVAIGQLAIHPSGVLIAGTGSKWDLNSLGIGKGVWLSSDSGKTWSPINTGITMPDPLIEALAITSSGEILAGIFDGNVGITGKYGIMKLDSLSGTWHRVSISVNAPFNQSFPDAGLRIESVFNINIIDGTVISSIEGVHVNFGYAFTIQKSILDIEDTTVAWTVKWVIDSIPSTGSYFEHLINLFKDSHDTLWGSVSGAGNEIDNNIFTGELSTDIPWMMNMNNINQQTGRFLFSEGVGGRLYAVSFFTGTEIFVRSISATTSLPEVNHEQIGGWQLYPNPAKNLIRVSNSENTSDKNIRLTLYDVLGNILMDKYSSLENVIEISLTDNLQTDGIYFLKIENGMEKQFLRFIKN